LKAAGPNYYSSGAVDDTPKAFLEEVRSSLLRKRVGQIALAVVLAEAAWRLVTSRTWYLVIPLIGRVLRGNTESVLFAGATNRPFPWENLFGSVVEFGLVVILVFYLNRWVQRKPMAAGITEDIEHQYSSTGEDLTVEGSGVGTILPKHENVLQGGPEEI
jgi:large-conductance mechanosensitive channel